MAKTLTEPTTKRKSTELEPPKPIRRTGDILRMDTNPTVPKAVGVIQVKEMNGELTAHDKKAFNWLLHNAYEEIAKPVVHVAKASDLRKYLSSHESNDRLVETTTRLGSTILSYDYLDEDGLPEWGSGSLIIVSGKIKDDEIRYEFPHWLRPLLAEPAKWARLSLRIMQKFSSKYAVSLYENLEAHANLRQPKWEVDIDDFRVLVGVPKDKLKRFNDLQRRVIEPSLAEINKNADFTATFYVAKRVGKKIVRIGFDIEKNDERKADENRAKHRNKSTGAAFQLKPDTYDKAKRLAPGADVYLIESEWREWSAKQGQKITNPDGAFLKFAKRWAQNRQGNLLM